MIFLLFPRKLSGIIFSAFLVYFWGIFGVFFGILVKKLPEISQICITLINQFKQTPAPPKASKYEEELEKIKLDLATISTTFLLTKNMRSKWRSEAPEVEEYDQVQETAEEETEKVEETVEEEAKEDEPDANDQEKDETVIDIE